MKQIKTAKIRKQIRVIARPFRIDKRWIKYTYLRRLWNFGSIAFAIDQNDEIAKAAIIKNFIIYNDEIFRQLIP